MGKQMLIVNWEISEVEYFIPIKRCLLQLCENLLKKLAVLVFKKFKKINHLNEICCIDKKKFNDCKWI